MVVMAIPHHKCPDCHGKRPHEGVRMEHFMQYAFCYNLNIQKYILSWSLEGVRVYLPNTATDKSHDLCLTEQCLRDSHMYTFLFLNMHKSTAVC